MVFAVSGGKRGPKFGQVWKVHIFLLGKHNDDFVPGHSEQARLSRAGMGMFIVIVIVSLIIKL